MDTALTTCHCCKKTNRKIHAVQNGVRYCYACYKREFKPVSCSRCGKNTRSFGGETPAYCKGCRHADKPCKRCGKVGKIGKVFDDGSISCPSCVRHFLEPRICANCGVQSIHLSRDFISGFEEQVCPKCRRLKGFFTCPGCGKNRRPGGVASDGRTLCEGCLKHDGKFICPRCGREGLRHSHKRCDDCYWRDYAVQKMKAQAKEFTHLWTQELFAGLIYELLSENGGHYAFLRVKQYRKFFMTLDSAFSSPAMITPSAISEMFGKGRFITYHRIVGYLINRKVVPVNIVERVKESDVILGQVNIIKKAEGKWFQPLLNEYYSFMKKKHETIVNHGWEGDYSRFVPSTITSFLSSAYVFLASLPNSVITYTGITQKHIASFLMEKPGLRSTLRGFAKFIKHQKRMFQSFKVDAPKKEFNMKLLIEHEKYLFVLKTWLNPATDDDLKESVICLLMLMYAQRKKDIVKLKLIDIIVKDGSRGFNFGNAELMLDARLSSLLERYLEHRKVINRYDDAIGNPYIFPGSSYNRHMSELSVSSYLRKHDLTEAQVFSTSMWKLYRNGLTAAKVVEDGTGVCDATAFKYFALCNPRLVAETNKILSMRNRDE